MRHPRGRVRAFLALLALKGTLLFAEALASPWVSVAPPLPSTEIDLLVAADLSTRGQVLLPAAAEEILLRRLYLDLLGTAPTVAEQEEYLADPAPDRLARLVERLFERPEFADYFALRWGDILRVKAEYPSNLWPNAVQAYHQWIREAMRTNLPFDRFARALLLSSGSNVREPAVNFYRAMPTRDPASIARMASTVFLGRSLDSFDPPLRAEFARFFSRLSWKRSVEWKEEIVFTNPLGPGFSASGSPGTESYRFPDGTSLAAPADLDPRTLLADWLVSASNPWFARAIANRAWDWLMGSGIQEPVDGGGPGNPAANPALLDFLAGRLVASGWDLRSLFRLILGSRTYAQATIGPATPAYARYTVRRLDAEVLIDALCRIGGAGEAYVSPIPEPFTYIPRENRSIALADGSITSAFLVKFGRPSRDGGLEEERSAEVTVDQKLYLLNSTDLRRRIEQGPLLAATLAAAKSDRKAALSLLFRSLLSRPPTAAELKTAEAHLKKSGANSRQGFADLAWALVNGTEFLFRH